MTHGCLNCTLWCLKIPDNRNFEMTFLHCLQQLTRLKTTPILVAVQLCFPTGCIIALQPVPQHWMMSWDQFSEMKGIKRNPLALGNASNTQFTASSAWEQEKKKSHRSSHSAPRIVSFPPPQQKRQVGGPGKIILYQTHLRKRGRQSWAKLPAKRKLFLLLPKHCLWCTATDQWSDYRHLVSLLVCLWSACLILFSWIWSLPGLVLTYLKKKDDDDEGI